jgi:hypothetical protein
MNMNPIVADMVTQLVQGQRLPSGVFEQAWQTDHHGLRTQIVSWMAEAIERGGTLSGTQWPAIFRW